MSTKQADHVELGDVEQWNNGSEDTISRLALRPRSANSQQNYTKQILHSRPITKLHGRLNSLC
ncbi:hypothetical protein DPMN_077132 [Dreissena polymorpha]|uniref:Uncharacterized protein n=1 Tax=Dreissena polymorpha TaxID=45954 RepID=A0A9D3YNB4_DREPO|nr:hypothetical protein DPMN_077132 [Dreissena polymorpha]